MSHFFINEINLDPKSTRPLYIQLANSLVFLIKRGILKPGFKLPGTRELAKLLGLNRNTVFSALDELTAEGWLISEKRKGFYVNKELPLLRVRELNKRKIGKYPSQTPYPITRKFDWIVSDSHNLKLDFNDGYPDFRLAPVQEIRKEYTSILTTSPLKSLLSYADPRGDEKLRATIAAMLENKRGLEVSPSQVMITRGSIMGLYLISQVLVSNGDAFAMENPGYSGAERCFKAARCHILQIPVDQKGMDVDNLENNLQNYQVRAVYVTSHHQHPTTVSLAPERRMQLLQLAQKHHFAIIEDDYDYEFHYENKPLLPIASADHTGCVIYIGSFSKTLFPSLRIGYLVAPESLIDNLARLRSIIDNNGDTVLERALSRIIDNGVYYRYVRKSLNQYRQRKNLFCSILDRDLSEWVSYEKPEGGMSVWVNFDKKIQLNKLAETCFRNGLLLSGSKCSNTDGSLMNAARLGFASMNIEEIEEASQILRSAVKFSL
jgi:GntR family transcriptional regulator / MocR family aminotransferase